MIKRPLLWGIGAYIGGLLLAWNKIPLPYLLILSIIGWYIIYLLIYRYQKFINRKDSFLWSLPILMFLGFLAMKDQMKPPELDRVFDDKASCIVTGTIEMTVKRSKGYVYYLKDNHVKISVDTSEAFSEEITYPVGKIIVYTKDNKEYLVGNKITVSGTIYKFSHNSNPGGFNERLYYKIQNIDYKVYSEHILLTDSTYSRFHKILNNIKDRLIKTYNQILPEKEAGILMAMVLGEKYMLEDEIKNLYQENGISHILAISGLHISMIGVVVYFILRKLKLGLYISTALSLAFVYSYGILTNFSVSTNRAVVMYIVLLMANILGKTFDLLSALSLSALIILLNNPMQIFHAGFLLSFGAVMGIALIYPCLNKLYEAKKSLINGIYVSVSTQVFTLPITLYYFFQIPVYSVFINILVVPLSSLLILSSLAAGVLGMISSSAGIFLAGGASYILRFYEFVCRLGTKLPWSLITVGQPDMVRIIIYYFLILIFVAVISKSKKNNGNIRYLIILAAAVFILVFPRVKNGLTVTFLDVGQGDAIFMETKEGTTFLIDGGSLDVKDVGTYRIKPYLLSTGVDTIDYAIVTHADMDHISGLMELIKDSRITISNLVLPKIDRSKVKENEAKQNVNYAECSDKYRDLKLLAESYGINLLYIEAGDYIREGMFDITCLHPYDGFAYSSENAYSTVLSVTYGDFDMLLTGDLEAEGEDAVISRLAGYVTGDRLSKIYDDGLRNGYYVLKVAHHGSRNSTSEELLELIKPKYSIISCGYKNRYGHPHYEVLERLNQIGSEMKIIYETGAITVRTDGKKVKMEGYLNN